MTKLSMEYKITDRVKTSIGDEKVEDFIKKVMAHKLPPALKEIISPYLYDTSIFEITEGRTISEEYWQAEIVVMSGQDWQVWKGVLLRCGNLGDPIPEFIKQMEGGITK